MPCDKGVEPCIDSPAAKSQGDRGEDEPHKRWRLRETEQGQGGHGNADERDPSRSELLEDPAAEDA